MNGLYKDREQTEAKHEILRRYLESFAHKVGRTYETIDYVDAFCGPWEERDSKDLSDTSIAIALGKLQSVAETLDTNGRKRIRCIFNEKTAKSFAKLQAYVEANRGKFPLLEIHTLHGTFENNAGKIKELATHKFMLLFVDPTGWSGFSPDALGTLIGQRNSEVIINFMRSFIVRHLCPPGPEQMDRLTDLLGEKRAKRLAGQHLPITKIEEELFEVLKDDLGFRFAAKSPIHNPDKDQVHFHLFYGTHHPAGMQVMRDAEYKALSQHDRNRFEKKEDQYQFSLFGEDLEVQGPYLQARQEHASGLAGAILKRLQTSSPSLKFATLRAEMQETHYLKEAEIKDVVVELADAGKIEPTWKLRKGRRPKDDDCIYLKRR
ncbi:three-Cys-motif partner protein TcmP [Aliiroseovarius sp.]|uniref:three-Cys-motif partner protein TcmP n=1 Tax=Aliiroseovarius sp. TaxID=1872442 RepID=UPI003BA8AB48